MSDSQDRLMENQPSPDSRREARAQELVDLRRTLRGVVQRLEDALDHLGIEAQRLADENSRLALVAEKLERRLAALQPALETGEWSSGVEPEPLVADEPRFEPGDEAVSVEVKAVPGFQALMDLQRGFSSFPKAADSNVVRYQNDEALLELTLIEPASAREILEDLLGSVGRALVIEEARPEALRLRLRFVDQEGE